MAKKIYERADAVNASLLRDVAVAPLFAKWKMDNPPDPSPSMLLGSAVHALLLKTQPVVLFDGDRRNADFQREKARAKRCGALMLTGTMVETCEIIVNAVRHCRDAARLLSAPGSSEVECYWDRKDTSPRTKCKAKVDRVLKNKQTWIELKTTSRLVSADQWSAECFRRGYDIQCAWYSDGLIATKKITPTAHGKMIVAETNPPYDVAVFDMTPTWIADGCARASGVLEVLLVCRKNKRWPGIGNVLPLKTPAWAVKQTEITFDGEVL